MFAITVARGKLSPQLNCNCVRHAIEIPMRLRWSDWKRVEEPSGIDAPAVYQVRLIVGGQPSEITRFLGRDRSGILSIGHASRMERRRRQFVAALRVGRGHSEINLLWRLQRQSGLSARFPSAQYEYRVHVCRSVKQAKAIELFLIKTYVCHFGEVPPLNSAIPGRYITSSWNTAAKNAAAVWSL